MLLDNEMQRAYLLELINRAHRAPGEVPGVEELRQAISAASVAPGPEREEPQQPE